MAPSDQTLALTGCVHARMGNPAEARKILRQLLSERRSSFHRESCAFSTWVWEMPTEGFRYAEMSREQQESSMIFTRLRLRLGPLP